MERIFGDSGGKLFEERIKPTDSGSSTTCTYILTINGLRTIYQNKYIYLFLMFALGKCITLQSNGGYNHFVDAAKMRGIKGLIIQG